MGETQDSSGDPPGELRGEYSEEVTQASYREIERLALWARGRGPRFCLIGGWAAWHYHGGLGSRDIDVVFPNRQILEKFLTDYYQQHGFVREGGLVESAYRKPIRVGDHTIYIEIDAAQIDQWPPFKEDPKLILPYTMLEEHHAVWKIGKEEVLVPTPELLLLEKVKAYRDRSWELEHRLLSPTQAQFLRGKVRKDRYDIEGVSRKVKHWDEVASIADRFSCKPRIQETLRALGVRESL
ncbi:MAG: hypothetical protein OK454_01250 [Thaumarchaeota archaeon]|nr:hypothetical protein [Nitrososphaerota archaeon]